jgi:hypothetical protein
MDHPDPDPLVLPLLNAAIEAAMDGTGQSQRSKVIEVSGDTSGS